jgi:hypothetical protein
MDTSVLIDTHSFDIGPYERSFLKKRSVTTAPGENEIIRGVIANFLKKKINTKIKNNLSPQYVTCISLP